MERLCLNPPRVPEVWLPYMPDALPSPLLCIPLLLIAELLLPRGAFLDILKILTLNN
jgi:hypothetical protein